MAALAANKLQNEINTALPTAAMVADRAKNYVMDNYVDENRVSRRDAEGNIRDVSGNNLKDASGNNVKYETTRPGKFTALKNAYGEIYNALAKIQLMADVAVAILALDPEDVNDSKNLKAGCMPNCH